MQEEQGNKQEEKEELSLFDKKKFNFDMKNFRMSKFLLFMAAHVAREIQLCYSKRLFKVHLKLVLRLKR